MNKVKDENVFHHYRNRAIGVVYNPEHERFGNYVPTILPKKIWMLSYLLMKLTLCIP
jgi:hypothetical protein